jgi:hypothetical protein
MNPALSHLGSIALSIGIGAKSQAGDIASKHDWMSPSTIPCGDLPLPKPLKHGSLASAVDRAVRNP